MEALVLSCPYCGEDVDLDIDEDGGDRQAYTQDCPVCCRPWDVKVKRDAEDGWTATLRKTDD
jgi:hypothetical protein